MLTSQEESEIRSDGTKKILKPSQLSLARVSVIRASESLGPEAPFIDDYIHTNETIVDYLTEFSGIQREQSYSTYFLKVLSRIDSWRSTPKLFDSCIVASQGCL